MGEPFEDKQPHDVVGWGQEDHWSYFDGASRRLIVTDLETRFPTGELIGSQTDSEGMITMCNEAWAGLESMNNDPGSAELLAGLGAPNGWERLSIEDTRFMIDLMDALSQQ